MLLKPFSQCKTIMQLNSLPHNKILDWRKLKAFEDYIINDAEMMIFLSDKLKNIVGKGENAGFQDFLLFPKMFSKAFFFRGVKSQDYVAKS